MKRYRLFSFDFDSRPSLLSSSVNSSWEPEIQQQHLENRDAIVVGLMQEFGTANSAAKIQDFQDLGNAPLSIISFHNRFMRQVRQSFVIGAYYPALVGACTLGERILNHLVLELRGHFQSKPGSEEIFENNNFTNWNLVIRTLEEWGVLLPDVATAYKELARIRHGKAIHFNPKIDKDDRTPALKAIHFLTKIVGQQFSGFGLQPWFIPNTPGASFIKKEAEAWPFVQVVYIPNCVLVGPYHEVDLRNEGDSFKFVITDKDDYEERDVTDEEFAELYNNRASK